MSEECVYRLLTVSWASVSVLVAQSRPSAGTGQRSSCESWIGLFIPGAEYRAAPNRPSLTLWASELRVGDDEVLWGL